LPAVDFSQTPPHEARKTLAMKLPQRLAEMWLANEGFPQPVPSVKKIDARLHQWVVQPSGTEGFEKAEVTAGGVSTSELSSTTMEARNVPGLFFIGEVVDVTGLAGRLQLSMGVGIGLRRGAGDHCVSVNGTSIVSPPPRVVHSGASACSGIASQRWTRPEPTADDRRRASPG